MKRSLLLFAAAFAALMQVSCTHAPPANVAAEVNGHAITYQELDKHLSTTERSPSEQAERGPGRRRQAGTRCTWHDHQRNRQAAGRAASGLTAVDADVDAEFNKMKSPYTKEQFEARLAEKHMTADDLKTQIRHDLTINKLINKEITSHVFDYRCRRSPPSSRPTRPPSITPSLPDPSRADSGHADPDSERAQSEEQQGAERKAGEGEDRGHCGPAGSVARILACWRRITRKIPTARRMAAIWDRFRNRIWTRSAPN